MDPNLIKNAKASGEVEKTPEMHVLGISVLVAILFVVGGFMAATKANVDYICTRIIEDTGSCTNGAWGTWDTVVSDTDTVTGQTTTIQQRVYTGTRITRHIISYLNRRTACGDGYIQEEHGNTDGASGFHDQGTIITESQVCQVEEQRTVYEDGTIDDVITIDITGDDADVTGETITVDDLEEINAFRRAQLDLGLYAQPVLVAPGQTTTVGWTTVEMSSCRVTADKNDDEWGAEDISVPNATSVSGEEESSEITEETTYTLDCIDFEGNPHQEAVSVRLVPNWEEF